ncbi:MAG: hypothetical protein HYX96_05390 [Chloroflexi bacterium]|nr:hypothetical protein [Chloroflexota bacterium]
MDNNQTAKPVIAGVLLLISAGFKLLGFFALLAASIFVAVPDMFPRLGFLVVLLVSLPVVFVIAMTVAGGIASLQRRRWTLALTGAIIAILPFSFLGVAATILIALSREEFER